MKKPLILGLLLVAFLLGILISVWHGHHEAMPPAAMLTNAGPSNAIIPSASNVVVVKPAARPFLRPPGLDNAGWKYLSTVREMMLVENQPVEFYARVVDQDGNSVSGARLELKLTRVDVEKVLIKFPHMNMGEEQTTQTNLVYSDSNGWIKFVGATGHYLYIWDLSAEGYASDIAHNLDTLIYEPGGKRSVNRLVEMYNAFDPKKGYTFHLWKMGATEQLVAVNYTIGVEPDGTNWHSLNLFRGPVDDVGEGDFQFQLVTEKDAKGNPGRRFHYQAPLGGLAVDTEPYPYLAPAQGYEPAWEWYYEPYGRNEKDDSNALFKRKFYVKGRNGKIYAALTWNWYTANAAQISGYVNPNGSRNLEPDPEKLITDPAEIQRLDEQTRVR